MLQTLYIENFAIVERLEIQFNQGLTIITGETGAGKSILIDSMGCLLGDRADSQSVRTGCQSAQIIGIFQAPATVQNWLAEQDLLGETSENNAAETQTTLKQECIIRRVIAQNGRSRCYINDRPVALQTLKQLGELLIDIHGQHANQSLLKVEMQRQIVDAMAEDEQIVKQVAQSYQQWKMLKTELDELGGQAKDREARLDLLRYQVEELATFELTANSIEQLEEEHKLLAHASKLVENSQLALQLLSNDKVNVLSLFNKILKLLADGQQFDERLAKLHQQIQSVALDAEAASDELRHYVEHLEIDPARLAQIEQQLADLQDVARKHRVHYSQLPQHFIDLQTQLNELVHYEQRATALESEVASKLKAYQHTAEQLRAQRLQTAARLSPQISENIQRLGMPNGQVVISVTPTDGIPSPQGLDKVEFLVTANVGQPPRPLHKVASGGELSRISLAIQVLTAQRSGVDTLVFDEVDVGIGGGVAEIVGQLLQRLGAQRQVFCITHQPQVACQGDFHLHVRKVVEQQQTRTQIHWLEQQQRIEEVARMLGGVEITPQTLAHATEMLQWNQRDKG